MALKARRFHLGSGGGEAEKLPGLRARIHNTHTHIYIYIYIYIYICVYIYMCVCTYYSYYDIVRYTNYTLLHYVMVLCPLSDTPGPKPQSSEGFWAPSASAACGGAKLAGHPLS